MRLWGYPGILVSRYPSIQVSWYPGILVSWYPGILVSKYPGILVSWYPGILVSKYPGILVSWYPGIQVSRYSLNWAQDLKNSGKYGSGLSCRWTLFTAWALGFKLHLIFHRVELNKTGLIFYLADFHGRNSQFLWEQDATLSLILH